MPALNWQKTAIVKIVAIATNNIFFIILSIRFLFVYNMAQRKNSISF